MYDKPLIIFDCDGVLIDSEAIYLEEEFATLASHGIFVDRGWYLGEFMALAQPLWRAKFSKLIEDEVGQPLSDTQYEEMKKRVRQRILNEVKTVDGIEDLLDAITTNICVASTTQMKFLPGKLERTGLADYFGAAVYSGDMVENGKPAPDLFLLAAKKTGRTPDQSIVVEDSVNGVRGGKSARMFTIGFTGGSHTYDGHGQALLDAGANIVVDSHSNLHQWLSKNTNVV